MEPEAFLRTFISGYLLLDLKTMLRAKPATPDGHLGYPILMSCAAGIEMLGILASPRTFAEEPEANFVRYWQHYLYHHSDPRKAVGSAIYQLARHGIAHNFAAKAPLCIAKRGAYHLVRDEDEVILTVSTLCLDLLHSYRTRFLPVSRGDRSGPQGETRDTTRLRLDEVVERNERVRKNHAQALMKLNNVAFSSRGASGPHGPVNALSSGLSQPSAQSVVTAPHLAIVGPGQEHEIRIITGATSSGLGK
jgi:hypothetical protein